MWNTYLPGVKQRSSSQGLAMLPDVVNNDFDFDCVEMILRIGNLKIKMFAINITRPVLLLTDSRTDSSGCSLARGGGNVSRGSCARDGRGATASAHSIGSSGEREQT